MDIKVNEEQKKRLDTMRRTKQAIKRLEERMERATDEMKKEFGCDCVLLYGERKLASIASETSARFDKKGMLEEYPNLAQKVEAFTKETPKTVFRFH